MPNSAQAAYDQLADHVRQTAMLCSIGHLLGWDERTKLPVAGGAYRAEQIAYLSGVIHERCTDPRISGWLDELTGSKLTEEPHSDIGATIRHIRRDFDKHVKLPKKLVEEMARATVLGQQAWVEARANDDFVSFKPVLSNIMRLSREKAECLGYAECVYDALLDEYEPDELTSNVTGVLEAFRKELVPLVREITESPRRPKTEIVRRRFPIAQQESFGKMAAEKIGFDFLRGRLDETDHPFCSGMGPNDCRITTRYDENFFPSAFFGILHEAGHGIYDQGLRNDWFGLAPGDYISLGIHESQSRMWENLVGRSRSFWQHFYVPAQRAFPDALADVSGDDFFFAINDVRPSLIRVEADEVTYNLHILIRFELEQALMNDSLRVDDLPEAWNDKYESYLGIRPPSNADGVMQDVHWSAGLIGYFPTYSLGNLYASQFFATANEQIGPLDEQFARGDFEPLLNWLNRNIHQPGKCYSAAELVKRVTGQPLSHDSIMADLRSKYGSLYLS